MPRCGAAAAAGDRPPRARRAAHDSGGARAGGTAAAPWGAPAGPMAARVARSREDSPLRWDIIHQDHVMGATATYIYCIVQAAQLPKASRVPSGVAGGTRPSVVPLARSLWLVLADVPLDVYGPGPLDASLRDMAWV